MSLLKRGLCTVISSIRGSLNARISPVGIEGHALPFHQTRSQPAQPDRLVLLGSLAGKLLCFVQIRRDAVAGGIPEPTHALGIASPLAG
jgi:hypothetical protein